MQTNGGSGRDIERLLTAWLRNPDGHAGSGFPLRRNTLALVPKYPGTGLGQARRVKQNPLVRTRHQQRHIPPI
jgi:hypothetical protein